MRMRLVAVGLLGLMLVAGACSGTETTTTPAQATTGTTIALTTTTTAATSTSQPPTTTAPPTTTLPATTLFAAGAGVELRTSQECPGLGDAVPAGSVTWGDGSRIWEATTAADVRCLFHVDGELSSIVWGPQGDRALLNQQLIIGGPANGQVIPRGVDWQFTFPTGLNLFGLEQDGTLMKWATDGDKETVVETLDRHDAVAYHPSGLHIAVGGAVAADDASLAPTEGIFIAASDGTDPVNLILAFEVTVLDIAFATDGSTMYFIAAHDGSTHLHTADLIPTESEEGVLVLGSGPEEFAPTLATSSGGGRVEFTTVIVHPTDPGLAIWSTDECAPDGSRGFQVFSADGASVIQAIGPAAALGFVGGDPEVTTVAAISGPCSGPRDVGLLSANVATGEVDNVRLANDAVVAAVRSVAGPALHDLVDVAIVGFA